MEWGGGRRRREVHYRNGYRGLLYVRVRLNCRALPRKFEQTGDQRSNLYLSGNSFPQCHQDGRSGGTTHLGHRWRCDFVPQGRRRSSGHFMKRQLQKSLNTKRSVRIGRHKTSVSLEDAFWKDIQQIAAIRKVSLPDLLTAIDTGRHYGGLSSAIRLFVLEHYRAMAERPEGHAMKKGRPVRAAHSGPI
jgi:predicted DNA-binding ribbon-helix-helix protein